MRVRIKHETRYDYEKPTIFGVHDVRLRPAAHTRARVLAYNLDVQPKCTIRWQYDPWSNHLARIDFPEERARQLAITVDAEFEIKPLNPFDFFVDERCEAVPFTYPDGLAGELAPFLARPSVGERLAAFIETLPRVTGTIDFLTQLNRHVANTVRYIIRNEPGVQTSEETLQIGSGSCRDSARLLCDILRAHGLAARFVSGYLIQLKDEGIIPGMPRGVAQDVVDLHAWAEVFVPGGGWIGLDGTSGLLCGEGHIPLAATVLPELAAPVTGTASEPGTPTFNLEVARVGYEPSPRRPYEDDTWERIVSTGDTVDRALTSRGIALTSGGEPTWTSRLHPREPEWNTEAVGATKWAQGLAMAEELSRRLGTGTLAMHRFGKLYPGESLPRWALHMVWREDGVPIWRDRERLAFRDVPPVDRDHDETASALAVLVAKLLGVAAEPIRGYEDPWAAIRDEMDLPLDVDPRTASLDDPEQRRRLAKILERGILTPVGVAVPLLHWDGQWLTGPWTFRRGRMFLVPGDSPMGLRLPLDRIGGTPVEIPDADVTVVRGPLRPDPRVAVEMRAPSEHRHPQHVEQVFGEGSVVRTALCVEVRDGIPHVFLPPVPTADAFLDLIAAVENAAQDLDLKVRVEGYPPPSDPRIQSCLVTPDPGVIEVNTPICHSFREYTEFLEVASDAANHAGLCTEKYQLDGRETGSGGGNHITLGGPTTAESPWLRQPALVGSVLRYVQQHPSLSYLFAGLFVGATSQAPRIDEARLDTLDELELALAQVPPPDRHFYPWMIDRALRNLLVDVSGNTHRTEICIDKLYAPEGPSGRQGIVEFRAFEMPPHERMAAVQLLLLRALVAWFAAEPRTQPFVRWGTALHDRFMLPYYLEQDIRDVAADLQRAGFDVDAEWFRPFLDYRFPVFGTIRADDVEVEIRSALQPWPTLGEQPVGPVVARYVDSSLERLQVRASGLIPGRHTIAVNGIELPMHPTATALESVAGVMFRAWQPPFCLQPHIGIHHPLRFDVVDTWGKRSLGAGTYHVWHPEGRAFEDPPLTRFEAAARRHQRFTRQGHAPWPVQITPAAPHPSHPVTLDLRLAALTRGEDRGA